ncbi:HK97 family phage major capsid protein/HK97 family phage prohead protease [Nitrobacteraceae bacterium AZCC 1564]
MNRAYSLLQIKAVDDDRRVITGIATTPTADRAGDIVEPLGAEFKLPIPLLWQHDSSQPIGHVTNAKVTAKGIEITASLAKIDEPGTLKDRLDEAWQSIKSGLVQGLSIGFKEIEAARIEQTYSYRFLKWLWLELSAVTIPANGEATITAIKSIDTQQRAASGRTLKRVVRLDTPGASGKSKSAPIAPKEGTEMKTIAEQITALENKRAAHEARMETVMQKSIDAGRSTEADEQEEFDTLGAELKAIDGDLVRLRTLEAAKAKRATSVVNVENEANGSAARGGHTRVEVKSQPKLAPGIAFARLAKVKTISRLDGEAALSVAERMYGTESDTYGLIKAAVVGGSTISGNWAANLVGAETGAFADFAEYLRPATIVGKFGTGGIPALRAIPFRVPLISQTGGGSGYWVGQGKAKPLTAFDFSRTTLEPLKVANIAVLTEESIRDSSPSSEAVVRDALRDALAARLDTDFIDPAKAASAGVSPASITNGAETIASTGTDADHVRLDVRAVFAKFIAANNAPTTGVWIMSATTALALSLMVNELGQREFPGIGMNGGVFEGMPAIISEYAGSIVALVNASDIYLGDEGGVSVDMSREASLEMSDAPAHTPNTGTGASLVSMFQTNSVALRAERTINWKLRRASAVAYLTGVAWGGAVPAS